MSPAGVQSKQENRSAPPRALLEWLRASELPLWLSGSSLKYFRSGLPVARCTLDEAAFDRLAADNHNAAGQTRAPRLLSSRVSPGEIKLILDLPDFSEDFHCLIFRGHGLNFDRAKNNGEIVFTIDALVYRDAERGWEIHPEFTLDAQTDAPSAGNASSNNGTDDGRPVDRLDPLGPLTPLEDLRAEILRALPRTTSPDVLSAAEILRLAVLPASLDFRLADDIVERMRRDYRREEAEQLGRKYLHRQFKKLICGAKPSRSFLLMSELGMLEWFLPELEAGRDLAQNRYHKHDIFFHSIYTCDAVDGPNLPLRLAGLFHDLGKVNTRRELPNGEATFHNHEMVSTRHTERILRRFGFGPDTMKHVRFLVRNHMFHYTGEWTDRAVRRFVKKVPPRMLEDMITLRLADRKGSGKKTALPRAIKDLIRHMNRICAQEAELKIPDLAVDGHTLMELGMRPGPAMGDILKQLLDEVKANRLANEEAPLRARAQKLVIEVSQTGTPA